jgi:serine/threonine protein kinase
LKLIKLVPGGGLRPNRRTSTFNEDTAVGGIDRLQMIQSDRERALVEFISEKGDPINFEVGIELLGQLTYALIELDRQNLVHAALNPYAIWVSNVNRIRFLDFANSGFGGSRPIEMDLAYTLPYMSPESVQGINSALDIRSDIYSVGAIAYHMLSGHYAVEARTVREYIHAVVTGLRKPASFYNPNLPPACDEFLNRCLEVHPDDRYQTPFAMLVAIEDLGKWAVMRPTAVLRSPSGKTYTVPESGGVLGRYDAERKSALAVDLSGEEYGRTVSRHQAKLGCIGGQWVILPCLRTTNPTVLNDRTLEPGTQYDLADGDELQIGGLTLIVELQHTTPAVQIQHEQED